MTNTDTGISFSIFTSAINQYGSDLSVLSNTSTLSNLEGDQAFTYAVTANLRAYITRKNRPWYFDKASTIEGGDAIMVAPGTASIARFDIVVWNGVAYRVETVLDRDGAGGTTAYRSANLFKI